MKLNNIKIGYRLGLGFAFIIVFTGILGFVAYNNIDNLWGITENMYRHPFTVTKAVRNIKTNIIAMHRYMKDVALANNQTEIRVAKVLVDEQERQALKSFEIVFDRYLGKASDVHIVYDAFVNWKPIRDEMIQLRLEGKVKEAADITKGKGADYISDLNIKIQKMLDFADKKAESYYTNSQELKNATFKNTILLLSFIVLFSIIIAIYLTHSIVRPLASMLNVSADLKEGKLSVRNKNIKNDEIGNLAKSFNELADSVESAAVIQKGVTNVSHTLIGHSSIETFATEVLKYLMIITGANMSTFYILNELASEYEPLASIGANKKLLKPFNAENPEGEFGNAITKKGIYYLRDIPEEIILKFKTTAGEFVPKEIITIPIFVDNTVAALISLSNIHKFNKENLDIIKQSLNAFNSSYSTLLANERTKIFADNLQEINQQLEAQTEELQSQSEELNEQNIELETQKEFVEQSSRLKSQFLSNMSHELRTPLNSVIALSKVLIDRTKDKLSAEEIDYLKIIDRNGKNLLNLINDILDLSKIESGKLELLIEDTNLKELLEHAVDNLSPLAEEKKIKLVKNIPSNIPNFQTDQKRFLQVALNIIGNAIKFTTKGSVSVSAKFDDKNLYIEVVDTGIGISQNDINFIFDEFIQSDGSLARRFEGTGLGLAISKKIIKNLCGNIKVESEIDKGSKFIIIHPIKFSDDVDNTLLKQINKGNIPLQSKSIYDEKDFNLIGKRILLVEDNDAAIIQIKHLLENNGLIVDSVNTAKEALSYIKTKIPDGFILDIMLPKMDGIELLQRLRTIHYTKTIPVVFLTAKELTIEELSKIKENNVYQLIFKGDINKERLISIIKGMLKIYKESKETNKVKKESKNLVIEKRPVKKRNTGKPTILIVEDNPDNMATIEAVLKNKCTILKAKNGKSGLEQSRLKIPDLILMDILLPKMDGIKVMEILKKEEPTSKIIIIALTAHAMAGDKEKYLSAGFDDYITKPIEPKKFINQLNKWVSVL